MRKSKWIMKLEIAVACKDPDACGNKQNTEGIKAHLSQLVIVLAQVFIAKRYKKKEPCGTGQTGEETEQASEPPMAPAHVVEAEQDKAQKKGFVVTSRKEESGGED